MAQGKNATYQHNKEWWGKRPLAYTPIRKGKMRFFKRWLHKIERQESKATLKHDIELG